MGCPCIRQVVPFPVEILFGWVSSCHCCDLPISFTPEKPTIVSVKRNVLSALVLCDVPQKLKVLLSLFIKCLDYAFIQIKRHLFHASNVQQLPIECISVSWGIRVQADITRTPVVSAYGVHAASISQNGEYNV